jgi:hypothetical protein
MSETPAAGRASDHALVFVAGLHRSGTTALTRLLAAHPDVSGFQDTGVKEDEGQHLQQVYPSARTYGGAGRFSFDERAHLTETSPLATPANADLLFAQWARHWDLVKPMLVEKSPPNLLMTRFLQALYPHARFVVVMRHPVVVSLSTSRWRGAGRSFLPLIKHWLQAHEIFQADAEYLSHVHVLRYENLMQEPEEALRRLEDFLALRTRLDSTLLDPSRSNPYVERWQTIVSSRRRRDRRLVQALCQTYRDRIAAFGYDIDDLQRAGVER